MIDILDGSGRVVGAGTLVSSDWVLTAGACARLASEVHVWGVQRVSVREVVPGPREGAEAVALLRLQHAVCSRALPMDDGSNIGAGQLALPELTSGNPVGQVRTACSALLIMVKTRAALVISAPSLCGRTRPHRSMFFHSTFSSPISRAS